MNFRLILTFLSFIIAYNGNANRIILNAKPATALNKISLYSDSTFTKPTNIFFQEGDLFEVLGETYFEHEDDAQNQKFKWFLIKSTNGHTGWVFGDGVAVLVEKEFIEDELLKFYKQVFSFGAGFENSIAWIASIDGRDNFHQQDYMNPPYKELYLVITNENNKSVHINFAGESARGKNKLNQINLQDITTDGIPEFILQSSSIAINDDIDHRNIEVFSFQAGTLVKVFEDHTSLYYDDDLPSPSLYKFVEIDKQSIRIEYIDFLPCSKSKLIYDEKTNDTYSERCMEFVTYTYHWDNRKKQYVSIYEETRSYPKAILEVDDLYLREKPSMGSKRVTMIKNSEPLKVIKHYEKIIFDGKEKKIIPYLFVQKESGEQGFIFAKTVAFIYTEHAELLAQYYKNPPLAKSNWRNNQSFVKFNTASDTSVYFKNN